MPKDILAFGEEGGVALDERVFYFGDVAKLSCHTQKEPALRNRREARRGEKRRQAFSVDTLVN